MLLTSSGEGGGHASDSRLALVSQPRLGPQRNRTHQLGLTSGARSTSAARDRRAPNRQEGQAVSPNGDDTKRPDTSSRTGPVLNPGDQAVPGTPGTGENVCPRCRGVGRFEGQPCETCGGTGRVTEGLGGA